MQFYLKANTQGKFDTEACECQGKDYTPTRNSDNPPFLLLSHTRPSGGPYFVHS